MFNNDFWKMFAIFTILIGLSLGIFFVAYNYYYYDEPLFGGDLADN